MADTDFFNNTEETKVDDQTQTQEDIAQTIKVGEKEYSQDQLSRLVGLGEIGAEAEEKYGVKIDKIWPNHQRTINEKIQLEQELNTLKSTATKTPDQLSQDQVAEQARAELNKLGYVNKSEVEGMVTAILAGSKLQDQTAVVVNQRAQDGYPKADVGQILLHMRDTGIRSPDKAYNDLFETEIDAIKEKKLATLKPSGFVTQTGSTAGSKAPAPQKVDSKNLREVLSALLPD